ncbi:class F sortase [Tomitella fengzijianii]|uniref:Class F sortase n=1 Tax=Tomitella fengzijianii TaxID=2597660 RepID=A0A516X0C0_9ACTN|nr:class F sortase [Tomitella fengzijianii]QDQ96480.1 class F sortase [Tomitella fengzijianii]
MPSPHRRRSGGLRAAAWIAVAVAAVLVFIAGAVLIVASYTGGSDARTAAISFAAPSARPGVPIPAVASAGDPDAESGGTLTLDPLGITADIVDATVPAGVLTPPEDVHEVGIWTDGAPLDAATGTTVIAGHVNMAGQGPGALYDLVMMRPGQQIHTVDALGRSKAWKVTGVTMRAKADGVDEGIWSGRMGPRRLVVVTCGGELDYTGEIGDYRDNVYLYAEPDG